MEKVSLFIGFYHNVGNTFTVLPLTGTKATVYIYYNGTQNSTYKISRWNFHGLLKICENHKNFLLHKLCYLRYKWMWCVHYNKVFKIRKSIFIKTFEHKMTLLPMQRSHKIHVQYLKQKQTCSTHKHALFNHHMHYTLYKC